MTDVKVAVKVFADLKVIFLRSFMFMLDTQISQGIQSLHREVMRLARDAKLVHLHSMLEMWVKWLVTSHRSGASPL